MPITLWPSSISKCVPPHTHAQRTRASDAENFPYSQEQWRCFESYGKRIEESNVLRMRHRRQRCGRSWVCRIGAGSTAASGRLSYPTRAARRFHSMKIPSPCEISTQAEQFLHGERPYKVSGKNFLSTFLPST